VQTARVPEPPLSDDISAGDLDAEVRRDLRGLQKDTADSVARHLVAAGTFVDEDPPRALAHARFARARASRIAVVREAAGIAAYHAGEWAEALGELRAARRMGGGPGHLAVMADIERALGRPERAIELSRSPEVRALDRAETIELAIVAAGARRDLGELDAAVVSLQIPELAPERREPWSARLFYAYADNLLAAGRDVEALQWFVHAADVDEVGETDADRRIAELTGEPVPDDDIEFGIEDAPAAEDLAAEDQPARPAGDDTARTAGESPAAEDADDTEPAAQVTAADDPAPGNAPVEASAAAAPAEGSAAGDSGSTAVGTAAPVPASAERVAEESPADEPAGHGGPTTEEVAAPVSASDEPVADEPPAAGPPVGGPAADAADGPSEQPEAEDRHR
jgi:hypothetical protein